MTFFTGFAVYFIIWWLTLFVVLPFGVRTQSEEGEVVPGTHASSPARANFGRKLAINTLLAGVVFGVWYWMTYHMGMGLDQLPSIFPQDR
ncbi:MAG: DUF1467 family protein [Pseudomonadota bacterium]|nr:DUF1467 family protein [Pseudomonadota bacterium]